MSLLTRITKTCGPHAIIIFVVVSYTIIYIFLPIILLVQEKNLNCSVKVDCDGICIFFYCSFVCFLFIFNVTFDFQDKSVKYNFPQIHLASIQQERMAMKITMRSSLAVIAGLNVEMYTPASGHAGHCLF